MALVHELRVNGTVHRVEVEPDRTLLSVLRNELDLTGTKYGCGEGQCGACTVLVDGQATHACTLRIGNIGDKPITTIEGLEHDGRLHPLQQAFLDHGAFQCGYCTPGMIMAGVALLADTPAPNDDEIVDVLQGNLCRCGTYSRIMAAVRQAAGTKASET
jgi:aerobic-type carbon monoxide dehydrogenase small subunit (CoxS/CutS family)